MNKWIGVGRLTRDPEVRYTQTGKVVTTFNLAVDRFTAPGGQKEADFIPIVVWGKSAEACGNSISKGSKVLVDGRLQIRSYEGKDGQKRWATEVIAQHVEFLDRRVSNSAADGGDGAAPDPNDAGVFGREAGPEDDIPF